jgi:hypothetical protein
MGTFSINTKPWLRSIIAQRRLLIRLNRSHLDRGETERAIDRLETQLNAYPYNDDLYLARFVNAHAAYIEKILPGAGSSCYLKRQREWNQVKVSAILIEEKSFKPIPVHPATPQIQLAYGSF